MRWYVIRSYGTQRRWVATFCDPTQPLIGQVDGVSRGVGTSDGRSGERRCALETGVRAQVFTRHENR